LKPGDRGLCGFATQPAIPICLAKLEAKFEDSVGGIVWAKAAASDVFAGLQKEDWPVLHAMQLQSLDFLR
jgi:hypothetical protein